MVGVVQVKRNAPRRHSKQDAAGSNKNNNNTHNKKSGNGGRNSARLSRNKVSPDPSGATAAQRNNSSNGRYSRRSSSKVMPELSVDTTNSNGELRSPGGTVPRTPLGAQAAQLPPSSQGHIPDFITQTDASGRASTPRSAQAIEGARKIHPTGPKPHLHVDGRSGKLTEDDEDDDGSKNSDIDNACETFVDSFRMMCCCLLTNDPLGMPRKTLKESSEENKKVKLLGPHHPDDNGKKCLVLDLDETLVHSSFRAVPGADFVIPVQIEDVVHFVYVMKRPGVDEFLVEMAKHYEIVIYTASLNKYADPLLDLLDPHKTIRTRLFRESCVFYEGNYVKDLSLLDRDLANTIIIDNSPSSYMFHPENAIDCSSFIDDPRDRELDQIGGFLKSIKEVEDVRGICHQWHDFDPSCRQ
mmetsp:Transcript_43589/g.105697  ORF Transcript_43589/g.105697 Transcript_43589/m.105697 type:complete len:412 (-) Transcript_43589:367-1602(-)